MKIINYTFTKNNAISALFFVLAFASYSQTINNRYNHQTIQNSGWQNNIAMGSNSNDIMMQNQQQMVVAHVSSQPTQEQIKAQQQAWLSGKAPEMNRQQKITREMNELRNEVNVMTLKNTSSNYYATSEYKTDFAGYQRALETFKAMLQDKVQPSIADAYFIAESAYGNLQLSYEQYHNIINQNTAFIRQWLTENNFSLNDPEALHLGIQKFISDTLLTGKNNPEQSPGFKKAHAPYYYDYLNYNSDADRGNYFITKTLATGGGQCHTLPVTYLIFAEAMGVEANLAYNPVHSFIRYKNNKGTVLNYETTVDRFMPDQFYLETLPVMAKAMQNKLYMNSMNKKQVVASVAIDLAVSYVREHKLHDKKFIQECMQTAAPYFPNQDYINTSYDYLNKRLYAEAFNNKVEEKGIKDFSEIEKYPDVLDAYNNFRIYMEKVSSLGIQDFPESDYMQMMEYYDTKGKLQKAKKVDGKKPRDLFFISGN